MKIWFALFIIYFFISCNTPANNSETKESHLGLLWSYFTEYSSAPNAEPLLENDAIFVTGGLGLHKVSNNDGRRIWYSPTEGTASSLFNYRFIFDENTIVGLKPDFVVGFTKETGAIKWETNIADSTFLLDIGMGAKYQNTAYYTSSTYGYIIAIDMDDGAIQWLYKFPFHIRNINVFENGDLLIPHEEIHSEDPLSFTAVMGRWRPSTKEWVWRNKVNGAGVFSYYYPQIDSQIVYSGLTYGFAAIDGTTGAEIWRIYDRTLVSSFHVLTPDTIFVNAGNFLYAIDRHDGREFWRTEKFGPAGSTRIHYKNGYVYWGHHDGIAIFDAKTGKLVHAQGPEHGGYIWTSALGPDRYFVQTSTHLLAYELYNPEE